MQRMLNFIISLLVVATSYFLGKMLMGDGYHEEWYQMFKPHFFHFGHWAKFIWPLVYFAFAYVLFMVYSADARSLNAKIKKKLLWYLGFDLIGKIAWGYIFFRLELPLYSFILLITMNVMNIIIFKNLYHSMRSVSYIFLPYVLTILYAAIMNGAFIYNFVILTLKALE
jgi:tryptophan-rich sensory protein